MKRKKIYKKLIINEIALSLIISFVLLLVLLLVTIYKINKDLKTKNLYTLSLIDCDEKKCDIEKWVNDINKSDLSADFIIYKNGFFIDLTNEFIESPFSYSDVEFLKKFTEPKKYKSITSEEWLLYTDHILVNGKKYYIMLGIAQKVPWRLFEVKEDLSELLKAEMKIIKSRLLSRHEKQSSRQFLKGEIKADAFQIVREDGKVMNWGWGVPAFLPKNYLDKIINYENLPLIIYFDKNTNDLIFFRLDKNNYIFAISGAKVNIIYHLFLAAIFIFATFLLIHVFFKRKLVGRITLEEVPDISVEEAVRKGENELIEFKSKDSLNFPDTLLKSITSMANTYGGIIFIGIKDNGELDPISFENLKELDLIKNKLINNIKNTITPIPSIRIEEYFLNHSKVILKLKIGISYDSLFSFKGIFYRRLGSSDIPMDFFYLRSII